MKQITFQELAETIHDLPTGQKLNFKRYADRDLYGVIRLDLFECDSILMSYYGGGRSSLFDASLDCSAAEILTWLEDNLGDCENDTVYLLEQTDLQILIQREWLFSQSDNDNKAPKYANVSVRFKDDNSEGSVIISLTDFSEETADRVFHYAGSLNELVELADPDEEATVQNFIVIGLSSYSNTI